MKDIEVKHTPEPWAKYNRTDIFAQESSDGEQALDDDGFQVADFLIDNPLYASGKSLGFEEQKANAERCVACVNALAGYNPEAVKGVVEALEKTIELNRDYCRDKYGDADQAESRACVSTARSALHNLKNTNTEEKSK